MVGMIEASAEHFTTDVLPLYHGPFIKIRLQPSEREYTVSKTLLCAKSPVFSAMFHHGFREYEEQTATLQEEGGIISIRSIQALIQWLYTRIINFDISDKEEHVIELARLADKYSITGIESYVAQDIRDTIRSPDSTSWLTSEHIISGTFLPRGHPVRRTLAAACVYGFLQYKNHKFAREAEDYPTSGADLLREVQLALNTSNEPHRAVTFTDPLDDVTVHLRRA
ncbi:hypothetical protein N7471_012608 [Penicillium samsonianum]|uniref:uncharacterized protein n=1 Tax=Penicillium samsonianum TaxID=1882272 RepID=UPI0025474A0C|nr:uncharacterized protein N7471_012608 [Penicillium samsonianum]KAJ6125291.1 hypothetical protein N7471_012608 [Penicillium samsonianum]